MHLRQYYGKVTRTSGLSIIELLVAMGLSLLLVGGVITMFVSSRSTYETNERMARVQENARFALNYIVNDIRSSGYLGCTHDLGVEVTEDIRGYNTTNGNVDSANNPLTAPIFSAVNFPSNTLSAMVNIFASAVQGFNYAGSSSWSPAPPTGLAPYAEDDSDILLIRVPVTSTAPLQLVADMADESSNLNVAPIANSNGPFTKGQLLLIGNCKARSIFEVTKYTASTGVIEHDTATKTTYGNKTTDLGNKYPGGDNPEDGGPAELVALDTVVYYVRKSDNSNQRSLWRIIGTGAAQELIEGIDSIQLQFGIDTINDGVVAADQYVSANAVTDWQQVVSVSMALLARSTEQYGSIPADSTTYALLDGSFNATGDHYLRQVFTTTAVITNTAE